jgi:hypothetical protein
MSMAELRVRPAEASAKTITDIGNRLAAMEKAREKYARLAEEKRKLDAGDTSSDFWKFNDRKGPERKMKGASDDYGRNMSWIQETLKGLGEDYFTGYMDKGVIAKLVLKVNEEATGKRDYSREKGDVPGAVVLDGKKIREITELIAAGVLKEPDKREGQKAASEFKGLLGS